MSLQNNINIETTYYPSKNIIRNQKKNYINQINYLIDKNYFLQEEIIIFKNYTITFKNEINNLNNEINNLNNEINNLNNVKNLNKTTIEQSSQLQSLCCICMTNPNNYINISCGHMCVCSNCLLNIDLTCPICRQIGRYIEVYNSGVIS